MNYIQNDYRHSKTAYRALTISGISLVSAALNTILLPFILSPIALIFAHLSKGRTKSGHFAAKAASVLAVLALILNSLIIGYTIHKFVNDDEYKAKINSTFTQMYGMTMEEYTAQALQSAGISIDENGYVTIVDPSTITDNNDSSDTESTGTDNKDSSNNESTDTETDEKKATENDGE